MEDLEESKGRKSFFFEKKKQKTFGPWGLWRWSGHSPPLAKVFLLLFSKKEALTFFKP
jgi:hypothetical protein